MNLNLTGSKRYLIFSSCIIFLLFFRARWAFNISYVDETCYLESLHRLIGLDYPACYLKTHLPGVVLSWLPIAAIAGVMSWLSSYSFDEWLMPLLGLFAFICWIFTLFQIEFVFKRSLTKQSLFPKYPWLLSVLFLLNVPALDFVTQLTTMAHACELALSFLILRYLKESKYLWALILCFWLGMVRLNDLGIMFFVLGSFLDKKHYNFRNLQNLTLILVTLITLVVFTYIGIWIGFVQGHANTKFLTIINSITWASLRQVLFSPVESIFLYLPIWTFTLISGLYFIKRLSWSSRGGLLWMILVFFFNVGCRTFQVDGPHFRYFIGTYVVVLSIVLEIFQLDTPKWKSSFTKILLFGAAWYSLFVWSGGDAYNWTRLYLFEGGLGANYMAHDGSTMPAHLRKLVVEPLGLSPIVYSLFSWFPNSFIFSKFANMQKYLIHGCSLYLLSLASLVSVILLFFSLCVGKKASTKSKEINFHG